MNRILLVLVAYNNEEEVGRFVTDSIRPGDKSYLQVVVVNNGRQVPFKDLYELKQFSNVEILEPGKNLGYLGAANFAFWQLCSKDQIPDLFILSNSDLVLKQADFFDQLGKLKLDFEVAGPAIYTGNESYSLNPFSRRRISKEKINRLLVVFSFYPFYLVYQTLSILKRKLFSGKKDIGPDKEEIVYAVHGAFLILSSSFFKKGGTLEYPCFLYGEELFIAEQAFQKGMITKVLPQVSMDHLEHTTTGVYKSPVHIRWMMESLRYLQHHFFNGNK